MRVNGTGQRMTARRLVTAVAGLALAGVTFAPTANAASGLTSYQGSDYSRDFNAIRQVRMCDWESDGNDTHADYYAIGDGNLHQVHTSTGYGDCEDSAVFTNQISRHRAVEEVFGEDPKGPWVYPS